ncbi:MAG: hypothetical protein DIU71_09345 [Proteobacteria bacterium]|nr:MAG: hypothetical protein DIU71_09345 [Pseudomonadota bacterium]
MKSGRFHKGIRAAAALFGTLACGLAGAAGTCDEEARWSAPDSEQHFMVLAGREGEFYDRSGPAFVMLLKVTAEEYAVGAVGIYANEDRYATFGAVPSAQYEPFLHDSEAASEVRLRLRINGPQYERVLRILETWDRRAREAMLLYPDIALDNILLVKQATEELNRCAETIATYPLDWGLDDTISENNIASRVPYEYFKELRRLNPERHVTDAEMPAALMAALASPEASDEASSGHQHHAHHHPHSKE